MKRLFLLFFLFISSSVFADYKIEVVGDSKKWIGYPDSNYVWEGERLVWERVVKDEDGKDVTVKTYKDPIEIIADFKPESKVFGVEGNIERNAVKKFGGALKGFVWLGNVSGGGEVVLPFTAKHIFIATGDRLNPILTEIFEDPKAENYYEVIEGKTRVVVKSFSGIGGAAGKPPELIAHYKFNENTAGDNAELVTNGDFAADTDWIKGTGTTISGGEAHFVDAGDNSLYQNVGITAKKYFLSLDITVISGTLGCWAGGELSEFGVSFSSSGSYSNILFDYSGFSNLNGNLVFGSSSNFNGSIDNVSLKAPNIEDSSGNDHDGLAQQDTSAISVPGKINTAFDFTPNDYIEIPDHDDFTPALTPFSISQWVKMDDATNFTMASKGVEGTDGEWRFYTDGLDKLIAHFYDENIDKYIGRKYNTTLTSYEGNWVHLVMTYDGDTSSLGIKLYLNAARVDDTDDNNATFVAVENLAAPVYIGRYDSNYANGLIDSVVFISLELTLEDVKYLYNNGQGREDWLPREPFLGRLNRLLDYPFRRGRYTF